MIMAHLVGFKTFTMTRMIFQLLNVIISYQITAAKRVNNPDLFSDC